MQPYAALFSGQGAQYPGMGRDLWEQFPAVREIYTCAGDILGFDVAKTSFEGTKEELARTAVAQPAIFALSVAAVTAARQTLPPPVAVAGHSLGEFAALWCAGAFSLEDGFRIIRARAAAMDSVQTPGTMAAVSGGTADEVTAACRQAGGFVQPVNFNYPAQTVISGDPAACERAAGLLREAGRKVTPLRVSGAFHTAHMQPAADAFRDAIQGISFLPTRMDFYSNTTGDRLEIDDYPAYFARHMVSPVRFTEQMAALAEKVHACVEFGPGRTVATLAKKNVRALTVATVEDGDGIEKASGRLQKAAGRGKENGHAG